jgi:phospholipase/carboxylesterase
MMLSDPHGRQPVLAAGVPLPEARAAVVMLHGRGAAAADMIALAEHLEMTGVAFLAPQAADFSWYPNRFLSPLARNEPWLGSALALVGRQLDAIDTAGIDRARTVLMGFSQGACLALEYAVRHARRYGGLAGLSGGLIGPPRTQWDYGGRLDGTPAFLGCSDVDPHIPVERVQETAGVLARLGARVTERLYPGMGHMVNADEIAHVRALIAGASGRGEGADPAR